MNSDLPVPVPRPPWALTAFVVLLSFVVTFLALEAQTARAEREALADQVQRLEWAVTELRDGAW